MNIVLYGNGSSGNHGCEAIVRGTAQVLSADYTILSNNTEEDNYYGLDKIADIKKAKNEVRKNCGFLKAFLKLKLFHNTTELDGLPYIKSVRNLSDAIGIAFSVGGDNYCYGGTEIYGYLNKLYHKNNIKTILWGCSIEPEVVKMPNVVQDLRLYDFIVSRESITYNALKDISAKAILAPDPAFFMVPKKVDEIDQLFSTPTIGINVSPLVISQESKHGVVINGLKKIIDLILSESEYRVALIPHVVWDKSDDRKVLHQLKELYSNESRVFEVGDYSAPVLKYAISKCSVFVGARTHATIAAYSTGVPTLVIGYSVKARGIAKDLFGTENHYVLPVQSITNEEQLMNEFKYIYNHKEEISEHLINFMPGYMEKMDDAIKMLQSISKNI